MSLDAVESARVHLALNEESSFVVSDEPQNSASVVVRLHYGAKLNMDQVNAIVASGVRRYSGATGQQS